MAIGRTRTNKRSSSSSYASTVTTLVFIALCVFAVWMLTSSDSIVTTSRTSDDSTSTAKPNEKTRSKPFEDNPGDLPDDAIKNDESQKPREDQKSDQGSNKDSNDANVGASYQQGSERKDEMQGGGSENDDASGKAKENEPLTDENGQAKDAVQVSEESTMTQKQDIQQSTTDESTAADAQKIDQANVGDKQNDENSQQEDGKGITFSDETKKEPSKEELNEDANAALLKDDSIQQDKPVVEQQEDAASKQVDSQKERDSATHGKTHQTKDETDQEDKTTNVKQEREEQEGDATSQANTRRTKDENYRENKPTKQEEEATKQVDSQQETESTNAEVNQQDAASTDDKSGALPNSGIPKESSESKKSWKTQASQSRNEKERRKETEEGQDDDSMYGYTWKLCNVTAGQDYIPCLDNVRALKLLHSTGHFEHRERHCPEDPPTCLVPLPQGYKNHIPWPESRDKIWFQNVPHPELAKVKGHQNWVKVTGEFLTFPGGGTQFIHGALHYIDFLEKIAPGIKWGKHTRVILDVGCGVASFGGYLFERDVLAMSLAPKDEHEAQVQFALERGIPAISAVMGSKRLPFPSGVFDIVHCARCRVPWHAEGGRLLLELNRVLRPGGYFVWSATPVYQKLKEDVEIWEAMSKLTASMCWKLEKIERDRLNKIGAAIYRKPTTNDCYEQRQKNSTPMCKEDDDPNAAWYVPLQSCMHRVPIVKSVRGSKWPLRWPKRAEVPPYWLNKTQMGIYGKPAPDDFVADYEHWQNVVKTSYLNGLGISWSNVRNVMDMRAVYGGFAAALRNLKIWVMNVVNVNAPDTLPIIYERGLFGIYHDWCESFSTYPRSYDLLHADHLFSKLKERCKIAPVLVEIDRIVRPGGKLIVRDDSSTIGEVENLLKSLHWEVHLAFSKDQEGILSATKSSWRPKLYLSSDSK